MYICVYNVDSSRFRDWLTSNPTTTGCWTGPDHTKPVVCSLVRFSLLLEYQRTSFSSGSIQKWKKKQTEPDNQTLSILGQIDATFCHPGLDSSIASTVSPLQGKIGLSIPFHVSLLQVLLPIFDIVPGLLANAPYKLWLCHWNNIQPGNVRLTLGHYAVFCMIAHNMGGPKPG
jgi:hypothetical protein